MDPRDATEPQRHEIHGLNPLDPRAVAIAAEATAPLPYEAARLRRKSAPRAIPWLIPVGGLLVLALAAFFAIPSGPAPIPMDTPFALHGPIAVGGVDIDGYGQIEVATVSETRTVAELAPGAYSVSSRNAVELQLGPVRVTAGDVQLGVIVGAEFVEIRVERGSATAIAPDGRHELTLGDTFRWPGEQVAVAPSVEPPVEPIATAPIEPNVPSTPDRGPPREDPAIVAYRAILDAAADGESPVALLPRVDAFLAAHPTHPLAREARLLRIRLEPDPIAAIESLDAWMAEDPHARGADALELGGTIARDGLHDCDRAIPYYRALKDLRDSGETRAWLGLCEASTGDREAALHDLAAAQNLGLDPAMEAAVRDAVKKLESP